MSVVLGIDPGLVVIGYAVVAKQSSRIFLRDAQAVPLCARRSLEDRLHAIYCLLKDTIQRCGVTDIALETPFLGKNAQNFLKLGYVRGIIYLLAAEHRLVIHEFTPRQMKVAITGYGGAEKEQVARVLCTLFPGLKMPEKYDMTDALGIALCALWKK